MLASLASLALGFIHPYTLLLADLVPALYWALEGLRTHRVAWRKWVVLAMMGVLQAPLILYDLWVFRTQSVFAGWLTQNVTLSPPARIYLAGYGVLLVLGAIGTVVWARQGGQGLAFPLLWIGLVAVLVYLPWNLQRRFLEGVQVPLGLLAGVGLGKGPLPLGKKRWLWLAQAIVVLLTAISNLYLTAGLTLMTANRAPNMFWAADVLSGVDWLGEHASPDETVLAGLGRQPDPGAHWSSGCLGALDGNGKLYRETGGRGPVFCCRHL